MRKCLTKEVINQRLKDRPLMVIGDCVRGDNPTLFKCLVENCGHEWEATPNAVLHKSGCPMCAGVVPLTKEVINKKLMDRSISLSGNYINVRTNTKFKCLVKECGYEWVTTPNFILYNDNGCPKCITLLEKKIVNEKLKHKSITIIGDYKDGSTKTKFKCLIEDCNHEWETVPSSIIHTGTGCPKCAKNLPLTKEIINERLECRPLVMIGDCINAKTETKFKCLCQECQHEWYSIPDSILRGSGFPKCAKTGFNPSKPGILYYIKINHRIGEFYKIGITNRTVQERFKKRELSMIDVIFEKKFDNGLDAYNEEKRILKEYVSYLYTESKILSSGNSEIFYRDIFNQ